MIFVSSSCVKHKKIKDSVQELVDNGFKNIELSGGTDLYNNFELDLIELKDQYNLNYLCHNYFPPPSSPFVLNLASLDDKTYKQSYDHLKKVIDLSIRLGANRFAFHAGFFIDIKLKEIGKNLSRDNLYNKDESENRFCLAYMQLKERAKELTLHIENNVFSNQNSITYKDKNPFMMTDFQGYKDLKKRIDFDLLFDVAHSKVSSKSLGLNYENEFHQMIEVASYVHVSDNDGNTDSNNELLKDSALFHLLKDSSTADKCYTLEVYDGVNALKRSFEVLSEAVS